MNQDDNTQNPNPTMPGGMPQGDQGGMQAPSTGGGMPTTPPTPTPMPEMPETPPAGDPHMPEAPTTPTPPMGDGTEVPPSMPGQGGGQTM